MLWIQKNKGMSNMETVILEIQDKRMMFNDHEILWDNLTKRSDFRPFVRYVWPMKETFDKRIWRKAPDGEFYGCPAPHVAYDLFGFTTQSKLSLSEWNIFTDSLGPIYLTCIIYPHSTSFKDSILTLTVPPEPKAPVTYDMEPTRVFEEGKQIMRSDWQPKCTLECPKKTIPQKGEEITFTYKDHEGNFHPASFKAQVKTNKGFVSHQEIDVVEGIGKFKFIPLGLDKPDEVKIQVGIGKFSDVASIKLKV